MRDGPVLFVFREDRGGSGLCRLAGSLGLWAGASGRPTTTGDWRLALATGARQLASALVTRARRLALVLATGGLQLATGDLRSALATSQNAKYHKRVDGWSMLENGVV